MSTTLLFETNVYDTATGSNPIRTLRKEFDVNDWEVWHQTERDVIAFGSEANALLLEEAFKKKTRRGLPHLLRKILSWRRTGSGRSASAGLPIWHRTPGSD